MPAITPTYYTASAEGGSNYFDGTYVWTAYQTSTVITIQQFNPVTGAELNSYNITVTGNATGPGGLSASLWS